MNDVRLFKDSNGIWYTTKDILDKLKEVGAHECDTLFVHTDVAFGTLNPELKRKKYLGYLYEILQELNVGTLVFPAFTFSFCNKEIYDVKNSRTSMGALNEYIRNQPGVVRSIDPILSMIAVGDKANMFEKVGKSSLGKNSGYDILHQQENVKFLFLGAEIGECFTYIHYVEDIMRVPYRFDMHFSGTIIDAEGNQYEDDYILYAGCAGVKPACSYYFGDYLFENGFLQKTHIGNKPITCISKEDAYREIRKKLENDIHYFLEQPFTAEDLVHEYIKGKNGERIVSC
ncbi:AAC(3) family N-acetyltransferase [Paenibacillus thiaminolyticus]|uniref:Aminoglycoside N(3)-acetyltransferase n=1 Tax=Paenibacillus thiaminolyticus TaxID=49283 RepID=A0AAP9J3G2_PANTH|nr:AAC(3) family N-acetyltransferase [Paenibacillus thiaminolyticus]MCY9534066.1 AAC(3) family N-acetyltransferase [Paenibacillus thiaminolyticus]MCY9600096.1 AAC(3) family N-acetyltransferase [Paenibacillus thiaminolyticus]MCY9608462.1 AAC(3) family N-acetyltransferase [Paenibacillus thiaminolyticus]MCY9615247.1 AAC(3) family N-acetyltransferase [Paenibacillus thiaminolyticus]MCY9620546.1 AAC(3) family N-acetyltransferase [Paenibacillus thiaminolyticus]